jgi:membrane protein DedA with SNARE-associated domain
MPAHPGSPERRAVLALLLASATADRATTFLAVFLGEALSWAGVPALGAAAVGAAGALASQGVVHLWAVVVIGTLGAELGGFAGWWLGGRMAQASTSGHGRASRRRAQALATGARFAERWGPLMVFFVPSWVSGALALDFRRFAAWNLAAAFLWTLGAGLAAYGIGSAVSGGGLFDSALPMLIAVAALAVIALLVVRRRRRASERV